MPKGGTLNSDVKFSVHPDGLGVPNRGHDSCPKIFFRMPFPLRAQSVLPPTHTSPVPPSSSLSYQGKLRLSTSDRVSVGPEFFLGSPGHCKFLDVCKSQHKIYGVFLSVIYTTEKVGDVHLTDGTGLRESYDRVPLCTCTGATHTHLRWMFVLTCGCVW